MCTTLRTLVVAVLFGTVLAFDPTDGRLGQPKHLVLVAGSGAAAVLLLGTVRPLDGNPLRRPLAALLLATALSTLTSAHRDTALFGFEGSHDGLVAAVSFAVLFVAAARAFTGDRRSVLQAVRAVWFGAGTAVLLFGLAQLIDRMVSPNRGWDWARPEASPWTIGSTLGNPNHLGGLLAMLLPVGAVLAVRSRGRERRLVLAGMSLAVVELAVTASRGAWLAVAVSSAFAAALFRRELRPHARRLGLASAGALALMAAVLVVLGPAGVTKISPAKLAGTGPGTTLDLRLEVWSTAWRATLDHPLVGVGPDVFPVVFPAYESDRFMLLYGPFTVANGAHNVFLNTLVDTGVLGLASLVALLVAAARWLARTWPAMDGNGRILAGGLATAVVAYLVQACLNTQTIALSVGFWVFLGLLVAVGSPGRLPVEGGETFRHRPLREVLAGTGRGSGTELGAPGIV